MRPLDGVLRSPRDVTVEWLTGVMGPKVGARVVDVEPESVGTGQMGECLRYRLSWDRPEAGGPASVVVKLASPDETSRATAQATRSYEREVLFYRHVAGTVDIRTPHCWHAAFDPATGDFDLVLEDLAPAVQGDQLQGCSADQAAAVVAELAALQAPRWNDTTLAGLDWLQYRDAESVEFVAGLYRGVLDGFVEGLGSLLEPGAIELARRFATVIEAWLVGRGPVPTVVTHGDFRLDNMMFGPAGSRVAVVDWQGPGRGDPAADLAYFLGSGLTTDDRRSHERDLVALHHRLLSARGVEGYGFERGLEGYRFHAFGGLVMAVIASQIVVRTERGDAMFATMANRHTQQVLDLDSESLLGGG
ncbi:MAG TPA: DUF1679 domain-containing protein [Acidimicrobiales bacterium]|nr:DUF1679 domain-containing protein [Acidimicrobiales bacterium]